MISLKTHTFILAKTGSNCKKRWQNGAKESSFTLINYRGLSARGQVHKMRTKGSKYLTELHREAEQLNKFERQKDDKLLLYPWNKVAALFEQVRTRKLDFP